MQWSRLQKWPAIVVVLCLFVSAFSGWHRHACDSLTVHQESFSAACSHHQPAEELRIEHACLASDASQIGFLAALDLLPILIAGLGSLWPTQWPQATDGCRLPEENFRDAFVLEWKTIRLLL